MDNSEDNSDHPPLVLIEWVDSGQPIPGWQWLDQIEERKPHRCVSVGFLVQDDEAAKVLAPNLGASDGGGGFDQASGVTTIPTAAVQRMIEFSAPLVSVCSQPSPSACPDAASAPMRRVS
jgi:hypothetical protein